MEKEEKQGKLNLKQKESEPESKKPIMNFKSGFLQVAVWENKNAFEGGGSSYAFQLQKNYKDKMGKWQHTNSLKVNDLLEASELLKESFKEFKQRMAIKISG